MPFTHLHSHTEYSILDGMNRITDYVQECKNLGMTAAAITDHGVMYGAIAFYHACEKVGIKPVLGCEAYVAPTSRFDKDSDHKYDHLVLLAENEQGYYNLQKLCTLGFQDGLYYGKPRIDDELLEQYHEGLICLSACLAGRIPKLILADDYDGARKAAENYKKLFGEDNFFLEVQDHGQMDDRKNISGLIQLSKDTGIPLVATNDCHYTRAEDSKYHDILLCVQTKTLLSDPKRMSYDGDQYYVKSEEEMRELFKYIPEAVDNTQKIADRCNVVIKFHETKMPAFPVPEGYNAQSYMRKLAMDGLHRRYPECGKKEEEQAEFELSTIHSMGFDEYFLIVRDYINWAKENGIPVGPGRGSAAGSIVAYALGITDIDPLQYGLYFERFLNPERVSMPDIDVDFCYERREEVIEHVKELYGRDHVCQIVTFGRMNARQVIKDVGRVLDYPYAYCNSLSSMVPSEVGMTIQKALDLQQDLYKAYHTEDMAKNIIDAALRLEGLPRQTGTHAAGVIIASKPVDEFIPLARVADSEDMVSQFNMVEVEELGLLKMDFLGLRTLTVIADAIKNIKKDTGEDIDISSIDIADPKVYKFISTGKTDGVFQLETKGMQDFMKNLKPTSIENLIAGVSLYRPGPMDYIPDYIRGKNDPGAVTYDCPELIEILEPTYGCIVYQEQVMQIFQKLAGYSMGQADNIRRAMSKKKQAVIDKERESFVNGDAERGIAGCVANGINVNVANKIYDHMTAFARYAFNKAHAACYALITYRTAWLMYHYPAQYWAAVLSSVMDNSVKLTEYIRSAKPMGIKLLQPDINESSNKFETSNGNIRFALCAVKGVSKTLAKMIVKRREDNGPYRNVQRTIIALADMEGDKTSIGNLILAGALDSVHPVRKQMYSVYKSILSDEKKKRKKDVAGQMSIFDLPGCEQMDLFIMPNCSEWPKKALIAKEKEATGVFVTGHPLDSEEWLVNRYCKPDSRSYEPDENGLFGVRQGQQVTFCGMLDDFKIVYTKKDQRAMAILRIEDYYGTVECVLFPNTYDQFGQCLIKDEIFVITGKASIREGKANILVDNIQNSVLIPKTIA